MTQATLFDLIREAAMEYVDAAGVYTTRPISYEFGESKRGTEYVNIVYRVVKVDSIEPGRAPDEQVGRVIRDAVYFSPKALNRVLIAVNALGLYTKDELMNLAFSRDEEGKKQLLDFLKNGFRERIPSVACEDTDRYVRVTLAWADGRPQQVFNPETGAIEEQPGEPELRVTFNGLSPAQAPEPQVEEDEGPEEIDFSSDEDAQALYG